MQPWHGVRHIPGRSENKPSPNATRLHEDSGIHRAKISHRFPTNFFASAVTHYDV